MLGLRTVLLRVDPMAHDVFLSYSHKDKAAADAVCDALESAGIRVWMAPRDILPGAGWARSIISAINGARVMVLVFSSNANDSQQIEREVERAAHKRVAIVPVRIEDVAPSESLEYFMSALHWDNAFPPPYEPHFARLARDLKRLLESQFVRPAPSVAETEYAAREEAEAARAMEAEHRRNEQAAAEPKRLAPLDKRTPVDKRSPAPLSPQEERSLRAGDIFREHPDGPEMVVIPAGSFPMGSPAGDPEKYDDELPQHEVRIATRFAVGRFAVTFEEWDACAAAGGCGGYRPKDENWGRGRLPVINVSWKDAQAYVAWLSRETGRPYRLPSEAEWEYAARAGTMGDGISREQANFGGEIGRTVEVGGFAPNPFGLYNVHGNVWEWVEDCWNDNYKSAPRDGSAWTSGDCGRRVLRGGSWCSIPRFLRAAVRIGNVPEYRYDDVGLRVARTLAL